MTKSERKRLKRNRRKERRSIDYKPALTPTHFVRLSRVRVVIDPARRWYVVPVKAYRRLERAGQAQGVATYEAVEAVRTVCRGRLREARRRPLAGYLFVGAGARRDELVLIELAPVAVPAGELQRFADRIVPPAMAELVIDGEPVATFPGYFAGIAKGEIGAMTAVMGRAA